jgi:integrase
MVVQGHPCPDIGQILDTGRIIALARTIRDTNLDTRSARSRLKARSKPYYKSVEPGHLHLGYRKPLAGAGKWLARHYVGDQAYELETLAVADDYSDADGVAILNYRQALAKARERMVARAHHAAGKHGPLTVRDAVEAHLEFMDAHRKSGYDARRRAEAFILPTLGDIEVQALTTEQLRKWHIALTKTPARVRSKNGGKQRYRKRTNDDDSIRRRQVSANRTLTALKAALNLAWREGRTPSDAAWRRVKPFEAVDVARTRFLSVDECQRLINASTPEFRRLVQAALLTGCRYGELGRIVVSDFNDDAGTLTVRISKTGRSRHVVLTDEGIDLFRELCAGRAGSEVLLVKDSGRPWGTSHQAIPMRQACERARIIPPISFHGLRHTTASLLVMGGAPLLVVGRNLGHANMKMLETHYAHLAPSYARDAIRAAAPRFGLTTGKVRPLRKPSHA